MFDEDVSSENVDFADSSSGNIGFAGSSNENLRRQGDQVQGGQVAGRPGGREARRERPGSRRHFKSISLLAP